MSGLFVLITSYPKSGNTWTRIVLDKLRYGPTVTMNNLDGSFHGSLRRVLFDLIAPVNASILLPDEIDEFLPDVYRQIAAESDQPMFVKVHEHARQTRKGDQLYPPETVASVIYLVRHPFDVTVSTAHHFGMSLDEAVSFMSDPRTRPHANTWLPTALPEFYGSWSENVLSWLDGPYALTLVRYEDLLADPRKHFARIVAAAGLKPAEEELTGVIESSRFELLQAQEASSGFAERPKSSSQFFREGRAGTWQGVLSPEHCSRIVKDHGAVMQRLGYAPDGSILPLSPPSGGIVH